MHVDEYMAKFEVFPGYYQPYVGVVGNITNSIFKLRSMIHPSKKPTKRVQSVKNLTRSPGDGWPSPGEKIKFSHFRLVDRSATL